MKRWRSGSSETGKVPLQFAPRIRDLKNRRLNSFAKPSAYPALEPLIAGRITSP